MAYSPGDLRREIRNVIEASLANGDPVRRGWVQHAILSRHPLAAMPDRDFNSCCRSVAVATAVREVLRDLKIADDDPDMVGGGGMMRLPGYKHLQLGYPLERDGELVIVPIVRMTSIERRAKADHYRRMAEGCVEHANEMERYDADHGAA